MRRKLKMSRKFDGKTYYWFGWTHTKAVIARRKREAKAKGLKHVRVVPRYTDSEGKKVRGNKPFYWDIYARK